MKIKEEDLPNFEFVDDLELPNKPFTILDIKTGITQQGTSKILRRMEQNGLLKSELRKVKYKGQQSIRLMRVYTKIQRKEVQ